jgi:hypothetical protein
MKWAQEILDLMKAGKSDEDIIKQFNSALITPKYLDELRKSKNKRNQTRELTRKATLRFQYSHRREPQPGTQIEKVHNYLKGIGREEFIKLYHNNQSAEMGKTIGVPAHIVINYIRDYVRETPSYRTSRIYGKEKTFKKKFKRLLSRKHKSTKIPKTTTIEEARQLW